MDHETLTAQTRAWVETVIIGLNLCPFAARPARANRIRYAVSEAVTPAELAEDLIRELELLESSSPDEIETSLLIHPNTLQNFLEYNDFLEVADTILEDLGLEGEFQVASFHPEYQFEGTEPESAENYTNRSPWPMLHLLREASVSEAVDLHPDIESVPEENVRRMEALGLDAVRALRERAFEAGRHPDKG
jgi:hypothetical protein